MEPVSSSYRQYVALEHGTCLHLCRVGDISFRHFLPPWVWVISFDRSSVLCHVTMTSDPLMSNTTKSTVVPSICSSEVCLCSLQPPSDSLLVLIQKNIIFLCLMSLMWETSCPSFDQVASCQIGRASCRERVSSPV